MISSVAGKVSSIRLGLGIRQLSASQFVQGLTDEKVEANPAVEAYLRANFPEYGQETSSASASASESTNSTKVRSDILEEEVASSEENESVASNSNIRKLFAYSRDPTAEDGSRACRKMRFHDRMIPGLLYGSDPSKGIVSKDYSSKVLIKTPWNQLQRELDRYHHHFQSRVYDLTLYEDEGDTEGTTHRVLPTGAQFHPIQNKLYCANYLRYHAQRPIPVPITYINTEESPAMKRGGFIAPVKRYVPCLVEDGAPIPDYVELECTGLKLKDVVRLDRIIFPPGVKPTKKVDDQYLIGTVFGKSS